jgi:hypothetical protein
MTLSWKDVLNIKVHLSHIERAYDYAVSLGYEYFSWNGSIYKVSGVGGTKEVVRTGFEEKDVR